MKNSRNDQWERKVCSLKRSITEQSFGEYDEENKKEGQ